MGSQPKHAALLASIREWAADPKAVMYPVQGRNNKIVIFPEDTFDKTDEQLLAHIRARLTDR